MIRSNINAPIYLAIVFMLAALLSALAVPAEAAEVLFSLACAPPTTRTDDTPLALSELGPECRIYHRINGELQPGFIAAAWGEETPLSLDLAPAAEPYRLEFIATAIDRDGQESTQSNVIVKSYRVQSTAGIAAPAQLVVQVTACDGCTIVEP